MIKKMLIVILVSISAVAWASGVLTVEDFQKNDMFDYVHVDQVEKVFTDELVGEDLYKVTYLVEGECAPAGQGDACELVSVCEYVWVEDVLNSGTPFMWGTEIDCKEDIEVVLGEGLIDEL